MTDWRKMYPDYELTDEDREVMEGFSAKYKPKPDEERLNRRLEEKRIFEATPHYHLCDRSVLKGFSYIDPRVPFKVCGGCKECKKYLLENDSITPLKEMKVMCNKKSGEYWFVDKRGQKRKLVKNILHRIARAQGLKDCKICYCNDKFNNKSK